MKIPSAEVAEVANSVYIPSLNELTICLEVERLDVTQVLMRFPFEGFKLWFQYVEAWSVCSGGMAALTAVQAVKTAV